MILASVFPIEFAPSAPTNDGRGTDGQLSAKQGQVLLVSVPVEGAPVEVVGRFMTRTVPFFHAPDPGQKGRYLGLLGVDMEEKPGTHELGIDLVYPDRSKRLSYHVLVLKEKFPTQHLTLPKDKVDLTEEDLARVKAEQEQVRTALSGASPQRLWSRAFLEPVHGHISGAFGRARIINGQPRNPHNGEDIAAPLGTEVVAMNDGVVRLTADHFFSGKGVFLDHGLGLYSMYFHLSEVLVKDGEPVKRGGVVGRVGATGRASGPHLHLGVKINGARVNPYSLMQLPLGESAASTAPPG
jgi:murein DD-endopeptidase MepM/ murein hydrolase activator NlpD